MKIALSLVAIFITGTLFAQTTKRTLKDQRKGVLFEYYVSDTNHDIKEGHYTEKLIPDNLLWTEGFYKNDKKDSVWVNYGYIPALSSDHSTQYVKSTGSYQNDQKNGFWKYNNEMLDFSTMRYTIYFSKSGSYKDDQKVGVWGFYDSKGQHVLSYGFTEKKLLFHKTDVTDTAKQSVIRGGDTTKMVLDHQPLYLGTDDDRRMALYKNLRYPMIAKEKKTQGKVLIAFTVDEQGKTSNFRIKKDIGNGCGDAALQAVQLMEGEWVPAELDGKPVTVEYEMPVTFTIRIEY
jgi:TonB family protein